MRCFHLIHLHPCWGGHIAAWTMSSLLSCFEEEKFHLLYVIELLPFRRFKDVLWWLARCHLLSLFLDLSLETFESNNWFGGIRRWNWNQSISFCVPNIMLDVGNMKIKMEWSLPLRSLWNVTLEDIIGSGSAFIEVSW